MPLMRLGDPSGKDTPPANTTTQQTPHYKIDKDSRKRLEQSYGQRMDAYVARRQKQLLKPRTLQKTLDRMEKDLKLGKFEFEMNSIPDQMKKLFNNSGVQRMAGYAAANFAVPGLGTAVGSVVEGARVVETADKVRSAAETLADTCSAYIPPLLKAHTNLADLATTTITNINDLTTKLTTGGGLLTKLTGIVGNISSNVTTIGLVVSLILILAAMSWDWKVGSIVILLVLVYFSWPTEVLNKVKELISGMSGYKFQMFDVTEHVPIIGQIAFTLLAFFGVSQIPADRFYDNILKRMDAIPKAANGMNKIWDQAGNVFSMVSDEFKVYFMNVKREDLMKEQGMAKEIREWVERVEYYMDAKQKNLLGRDEASVREVEKLYYQMYRWKHTPCHWKALNSECQRILMSLTPTMNELFKFSCRSTVHEGGPRKAPLAVIISGDSGRGKSEIIYPLSMALLANRGCDMKNARNEVYVRNYETEYWDGYVGQKIAIFDDAFQMRDSPGNPSPEFMEAIRLINTAPAHVHAADLNDKGRFFSSEICLYTTNLKENFGSYITSINCPEAAMRRLNANSYRIKTNPEFEKTVKINGVEVRRLDAEKIKNCEKCKELMEKHGLDRRLRFCPHVQLFDQYNLINDEIIKTNITYPELVAQLKKYDKELVSQEEDKLYMYEKLMENPMIFEMNDLEEFSDPEVPYCGPIDLAVATDYVAYKTLEHYVAFLVQKGVTDIDMIHTEVSRQPQLWSTFYRSNTYGIQNQDKPDTSLFDAMNTHEISYNHELEFYHSRRNLDYSWRNAVHAFKSFCARVSDQIVSAWNASGLQECLDFIAMGLGFMLIAGLGYQMWNIRKCGYCGEVECQCLRVTNDFTGINVGEQFYSWNDLGFETYQTESNTRPLVNQSTAMKVESAVKPLIHGSQGMKVESSVRPLVNNQPSMKVESNVRPLVGNPQGMKVEMYRDQNCEMLEAKILNNSLYLMHDDKIQYGNVMFIKGTCFLINNHYIEILRRKHDLDHVYYLSNRAGRLCEFTLKELLNQHVRLQKAGGDVDASLVYLSPTHSKVMAHSNITKNFVMSDDLSSLRGNYNSQMPTYNSPINNIMMSKRSLPDTRMSMNVYKVSDQQIEMEINTSWEYGGATTKGDCGAPIILNHNSAARKIVGIHMASNGTQGLAQTITQEMLNEGFQQIPQIYQIYSEVDIPCEPFLGNEELVDSVPLNAGLMVYGRTDLQNSSGGKNKIIPSAFFDYVPHRTLPTAMTKINGVDPMLKGLLKYGKEVPRIDYTLINRAIADVKNNYYVNGDRLNMDDFTRVLSFEEAVLGVEGEEFITPINRGTSLGYPYALHTKMPGKREAFGTDEWTLNSRLAIKIRKDVEQLVDDCRNGIQRGVYWADTLKAERRTIKKVEEGKTRVFTAGPVHFTIAFRQYFIGFAAWIMHGRNRNEISVGTNVFSQDWSDIVRKLASRALTQHGLNVVAGDFSNFDGSLSSQILWAILESINEWYDDGEENATIRRTMWMHIVHAMHVNRDIVYQTTHSQPSGCPITAILNSIYNSVVVRISYLICARRHYQETNEDYCSMKCFNDHVAMVSYGDDNLIGISETILGWFNQVTIAEAMLEIGHEYTDETKTGNIVPIRDITDVAYLKRKFVWDERLNRYKAPLDLEVVQEIVQWTKAGTGADSITLTNLDVTMRELSLHSEEVFNKYLGMLRKVCKEKNIFYRFLTQDEYLAHVCDEHLLEMNEDFSLEMNTTKKRTRREQSFTLRTTSISLKKNYIFVDYKKKELLINLNNSDPELIRHKLALFVKYRNYTYVNLDVPQEYVSF